MHCSNYSRLLCILDGCLLFLEMLLIKEGFLIISFYQNWYLHIYLNQYQINCHSYDVNSVALERKFMKSLKHDFESTM